MKSIYRMMVNYWCMSFNSQLFVCTINNTDMTVFCLALSSVYVVKIRIYFEIEGI